MNRRYGLRDDQWERIKELLPGRIVVLADTLFLKSPQRIAALMMVMILCLMVYNLTQFQIRAKLGDCADTLPNQLGKPTSTPTLRWIFQLMEGIALVRIFNHQHALIHEAVSNLNDIRIKIIRLFGHTACKPGAFHQLEYPAQGSFAKVANHQTRMI
ncbi:hypothetical protein [Mycoavidus sp. B2-EB]|uniref:hypothetical protein n=1 Tax=Mycoavidus sp. B2-EB TaxID=2651972 RepID=UPI00162A0557|nr:hypothetical protein [Mycoavidus sp. B2-EB]BBO59034.1 hypothetical protein MPB2EB_0135 [Mycoavidus sp. B2-EB]